MYILGLSPYFHDAAAALFLNDQLVAAVEEERFTRIKHAPHTWPFKSIEYCLREAKISLAEVDVIAVGWASPSKWISQILFKSFSQRWFREVELRDSIQYMFKKSNLKRALGSKEIMFIPHHLAHAASAFFPSGFEKASILVMDGQGEFDGTSMFVGDNGIKKIREIDLPHSLGLFYGAFTQFLGFTPQEDEYKVMGLSSYGVPKSDLSWILRNAHNGYKINGSYLYRDNLWYYKDGFTKKLGLSPREPSSHPINGQYENVAASLQDTLEKTANHLVEILLTETNIADFCLSGGVLLNCKMNRKLLDSGLIKDIFIQPAANDAGTAIGSALWAYHVLTGRKPTWKMNHAYLGPSYCDEYIEGILKESKIRYEKYDDIAGVAGELLSQGKILGWFQGRLEWGPRALGDRSILADPRDPEMKDKVNNCVKQREPWRPFAPTIIDESKNEYLEDARSSPFMLLNFRVYKERLKEIPAAVHVDGTTRPQTLERNVNEVYYRMIKAFEEKTNVPLVLNTSFNIKGEPIVCTPQDALRDFFTTGLDYLAIGPFLVKK